jgi:hypothetical protein
MSPTFVNDLFRLCGKSTHDIISPLNEWNMPWAPSVFNLMGFVFAVTFIVLVVLFGHPPDWPNLPAMGMTKVADTVQTLSILEPACQRAVRRSASHAITSSGRAITRPGGHQEIKLWI